MYQHSSAFLPFLYKIGSLLKIFRNVLGVIIPHVQLQILEIRRKADLQLGTSHQDMGNIHQLETEFVFGSLIVAYKYAWHYEIIV